MVEQIVVGGFVVLTVAGAVMAARSRQILYNIIGLGLSLFGIAGLFLQLGSPFVAAMQVLIYIGGIVVAIVFAMMLSMAMVIDPPARNLPKTIFAAIGSGVFLVGLVRLITQTTFTTTPTAADEAWAVSQIGHALLGRYNLVFETLSVVLLLAIIGAILIARRDRAAA